MQNVVARMRWRRLPYHTQLSASKRMEDKAPDGPCARLQHHFFRDFEIGNAVLTSQKSYLFINLSSIATEWY